MKKIGRILTFFFQKNAALRANFFKIYNKSTYEKTRSFGSTQPRTPFWRTALLET
jgi:hypothetical protein